MQLNVTNDLPLIQTDAVLVEKALGQMLENATKYSPEGFPITICAKQVSAEIQIEIHDEGDGIAAAEREKIFERFYRSPRHTNNVPGTGLGLWIARALIVACGGHVYASSGGVGLGTTLSIVLPVQTPPKANSKNEADE